MNYPLKLTNIRGWLVVNLVCKDHRVNIYDSFFVDKDYSKYPEGFLLVNEDTLLFLPPRWVSPAVTMLEDYRDHRDEYISEANKLLLKEML